LKGVAAPDDARVEVRHEEGADPLPGVLLDEHGADVALHAEVRFTVAAGAE
jgi:hypothetical protein